MHVESTKGQTYIGFISKKSDFRYTRVISLKRVTRTSSRLSAWAKGSSEGTSQRWRAVDDTASEMTSPELNPRLPAIPH